MAELTSKLSVFGTKFIVDLLTDLMYSGGKSPNGECYDLGNILLLENFHLLTLVRLSSFFIWSSTIMLDAWLTVFKGV
jgi:hypothetical protein